MAAERIDVVLPPLRLRRGVNRSAVLRQDDSVRPAHVEHRLSLVDVGLVDPPAPVVVEVPRQGGTGAHEGDARQPLALIVGVVVDPARNHRAARVVPEPEIGAERVDPRETVGVRIDDELLVRRRGPVTRSHRSVEVVLVPLRVERRRIAHRCRGARDEAADPVVAVGLGSDADQVQGAVVAVGAAVPVDLPRSADAESGRTRERIDRHRLRDAVGEADLGGGARGMVRDPGERGEDVRIGRGPVRLHPAQITVSVDIGDLGGRERRSFGTGIRHAAERALVVVGKPRHEPGPRRRVGPGVIADLLLGEPSIQSRVGELPLDLGRHARPCARLHADQPRKRLPASRGHGGVVGVGEDLAAPVLFVRIGRYLDELRPPRRIVEDPGQPPRGVLPERRGAEGVVRVVDNNAVLGLDQRPQQPESVPGVGAALHEGVGIHRDGEPIGAQVPAGRVRVVIDGPGEGGDQADPAEPARDVVVVEGVGPLRRVHDAHVAPPVAVERRRRRLGRIAVDPAHRHRLVQTEVGDLPRGARSVRDPERTAERIPAPRGREA